MFDLHDFLHSQEFIFVHYLIHIILVLLIQKLHTTLKGNMHRDTFAVLGKMTKLAKNIGKAQILNGNKIKVVLGLSSEQKPIILLFHLYGKLQIVSKTSTSGMPIYFIEDVV